MAPFRSLEGLAGRSNFLRFLPELAVCPNGLSLLISKRPSRHLFRGLIETSHDFARAKSPRQAVSQPSDPPKRLVRAEHQILIFLYFQEPRFLHN